MIFSLYGGTSFFNARNFNDIIIDSSQLVVLSVGMTFVIIAAGIDLSVGSVLIFSSVVAAQVTIALSGTPQDIANFEFPTQHVGIPVGLVAGVATGLICGIVNGLLITRLQVPAFIVTLGMLGIALGLDSSCPGARPSQMCRRRCRPKSAYASSSRFDVAGQRVRITPPVVIAYGIAIIAAIVLNRTRFGRYTYAIGSNAAASRRAGINVDLHLVKVYALSGLLAGVAGAMDSAAVRDGLRRLPSGGQSRRDLRNGHRRNESVWRHRNHRRERGRRVHSDRAAQWTGDRSRAAVLAKRRYRRRADSRRLPRSAAAPRGRTDVARLSVLQSICGVDTLPRSANAARPAKPDGRSDEDD